MTSTPETTPETVYSQVAVVQAPRWNVPDVGQLQTGAMSYHVPVELSRLLNSTL